MSDNLAEFLAPEPQEYSQECVYALKINGTWVNIVPGTLDLALSDTQDEVEFEAVVAACEGRPGSTVQGILSNITGLKSVEVEEVE